MIDSIVSALAVLVGLAVGLMIGRDAEARYWHGRMHGMQVRIDEAHRRIHELSMERSKKPKQDNEEHDPADWWKKSDEP